MKKENDMRFEKLDNLMKAIEVREISKETDETRLLTKAQTGDSMYPRTVEMKRKIDMARCLPTPMESSEDLSNYFFLVKNLWHEVEVLHDKLDYRIKEMFRDSIKNAHIRATDLLLAKHGHERIFRVFNEASYEHSYVG